MSYWIVVKEMISIIDVSVAWRPKLNHPDRKLITDKKRINHIRKDVWLWYTSWMC